MKVMVIPIVVGALGTVTKGLEKEHGELDINGRIKTIQTEESWRTEETCCCSDSNENQPANAGVKKTPWKWSILSLKILQERVKKQNWINCLYHFSWAVLHQPTQFYCKYDLVTIWYNIIIEKQILVSWALILILFNG